jgi:hypothetical protein
MAYLFLFILVAILLSSIELCLGLWIGAKFGRNQEQTRLVSRAMHSVQRDADGDDSIPWTDCLVLIDSLAQQVQSLALAAARCQPALPDQMSLALSELTKVTVALQQRICTGLANQPEPLPAKIGQESCMPALESPREPPLAGAREGSAVASGQPVDLSDAIENAPGASLANEQHVFTYDTIGYMAPCDEHDVPHPGEFHPITCHAISVHTISFYADSPPDYKFLTISVGPARQVIFILCRVRHCREVYLDQQHRYLVSCEFMRRLGPEEIRWQDVYGTTTRTQEDRSTSNERGAAR